jgi:hypothetical protein
MRSANFPTFARNPTQIIILGGDFGYILIAAQLHLINIDKDPKLMLFLIVNHILHNILQHFPRITIIDGM